MHCTFQMEIIETNDSLPNVAISMIDATATWKMPSSESTSKKETANKKQFQITEESKALMSGNNSARESPTLMNINVDFPKGKLVGVIGPVGAGKSSLLQVILRELPLDSGSLSLNGSTSFASQEPWVFAASVRQNILFGSEFDHDRYNAVVKCCALLRDFEQFENGDLSIIGEKGSLSGGQKARIKYVEKMFTSNEFVPLFKLSYFQLGPCLLS